MKARAALMMRRKLKSEMQKFALFLFPLLCFFFSSNERAHERTREISFQSEITLALSEHSKKHHHHRRRDGENAFHHQHQHICIFSAEEQRDEEKQSEKLVFIFFPFSDPQHENPLDSSVRVRVHKVENNTHDM